MTETYMKIFMDFFGENDMDIIRNMTVENNSEWNSYSHLELIVEIENVFGVSFDGDDVFNFKSYNDGIKILKEKGVNFNE